MALNKHENSLLSLEFHAFVATLAHFLNDSLDAFELLALGKRQHLPRLSAAHGHIGIALVDVDAPDLVGVQAAFFAKETGKLQVAPPSTKVFF